MLMEEKTNDIFKVALRDHYTYKCKMKNGEYGYLTTEALFDCTLEQLDEIYQIHWAEYIRERINNSLLKPVAKNVELSNKLDILRTIFNDKAVEHNKSVQEEYMKEVNAQFANIFNATKI